VCVCVYVYVCVSVCVCGVCVCVLSTIVHARAYVFASMQIWGGYD